MTKEYTSVRVSVDAKATADESKRDGETWDEFIQRCAETPPETREFVGVDELLDALDATIGELETSIPKRTADELEGRMR